MLSAQQILVAGWDFSQYAAYSLVGADYTFTDNMYADFSGLDTTGLYSGITGPEETSYGMFYYGGQFGSSIMLDANDPMERGITHFEDLVSNDEGANSEYYEVGFSNSQKVTFLTEEGQDFVNNYSLAFDPGMSDQSFVFEAHVGDGQVAHSWTLAFAGKMQASGTYDIAWEYSADGSSYESTGVTTTLTDLDTRYEVDLSSHEPLNGVNRIFIRGTLTGAIVEANSPLLDNVSIHATLGGGQGPVDPFGGSQAGDAGWYYSDWFEWYWPTGDWYFSALQGWVWPETPGDTGFWLWIHDTGNGSGGWFFATPEFYPYLYDSTQSAWIWRG
ncbi:MAG: hypothetical protein Q7P63_08470 [Verrucomicrobiota bacterium JB022]|nr:hypothetical protein [Verrucomicrobiota bacterium JB022]